jgi:hypothetical protein
MEFQDDDMTSLKGMIALPATRARETQMAYVDGYLLALQDVLREIKKHKDAVAAQPQIAETHSYFVGAAKMHREVRKSIEAMIVTTKKKLHMLQVHEIGNRIVEQDAALLERLKETDGAD